MAPGSLTGKLLLRAHRIEPTILATACRLLTDGTVAMAMVLLPLRPLAG